MKTRRRTIHECVYFVTLVWALCSCDPDPMTLIYELDLDTVKMYLCTKIEVSGSTLSKVRAWIAHIQTRSNALPAAVTSLLYCYYRCSVLSFFFLSVFLSSFLLLTLYYRNVRLGLLPGNECDGIETNTMCRMVVSLWSTSLLRNVTYTGASYRSSDILQVGNGHQVLAASTDYSSVAASRWLMTSQPVPLLLCRRWSVFFAVGIPACPPQTQSLLIRNSIESRYLSRGYMWNKTILKYLGHATYIHSNCYLKTHVQNLGYPLPLQIGGPKPTFLGRLLNLVSTLSAYIFGTKPI